MKQQRRERNQNVVSTRSQSPTHAYIACMTSPMISFVARGTRESDKGNRRRMHACAGYMHMITIPTPSQIYGYPN